MHCLCKFNKALRVDRAVHRGAVGQSVAELPVAIQFVADFPVAHAVALRLIRPFDPFGSDSRRSRADIDSHHCLGAETVDPLVLGLYI